MYQQGDSGTLTKTSILMYGNMYNLLISSISYEAWYKGYDYQKLFSESENFCHTPAYLATLLHSNNTKDVKELMAYIRKTVAEGSSSANFIIALKDNVFIFNANFRRGGASAAYSELLDQSKSTFFFEFAGL